MLDSPVPIQALKSTNIGPGAMPVLIRTLGVAGIGSDTDAAKGRYTRPAKPCVPTVRCGEIRNNPNYPALRPFIDYLG